MLRVRPLLTYEPEFREWTRKERESWLAEQAAEKLAKIKDLGSEIKKIEDLGERG